MIDNITGYRIFLASPDDLSEERNLFFATIGKFNDNHTVGSKKLLIELIPAAPGTLFVFAYASLPLTPILPRTPEVIHKYKFLCYPVAEDTVSGGFGDAQELINKPLRECDYFIGMFWQKAGSPTPRHKSGTIEECREALECCKNQSMLDMTIFFKQVNESQLNDPGQELQKVLDFKKEIQVQNLCLYKTFDSTPAFARLLESHLMDWILYGKHNHGSKGVLDIADPTNAGGIGR